MTEQQLPDEIRCTAAGCNELRMFGSTRCEAHAPAGKRPGARQSSGAAQPSAGSELLCPHCQVRGKVTRKEIKAKRGVSGGKVTGAVLTGGLSMLGTGLSRKQKVTEMHCGNCGTTWHVE